MDEKKKIKVKFVDFQNGLDETDNFFIDSLKKNFDVEVSDDPDYLFFGAYGYKHLDYDCIRIMWTIENYVPDFNIADYALSYEIMEFGDRHLRFPFFLNRPEIENVKKTIERKPIDISKKKDFCSFVVSNEWGDDYRIRLFHELSKYKKVDSGGRSLNNIGGPIGMGLDKKFEFDSTHKFSFALENAQNPGYTTEKITDAFAAGCIPIYWGDPNIEEEFNPKSFINCNDLTVEEAVERIKEVDQNDELYKSMLNEPAFLGDLNKYLDDFDNFLFNICNQPLEKAYRRDRVMKGKTQEHQYKLINKIYYKPYNFLIKVAKTLHIEFFGRKIYHLIRD